MPISSYNIPSFLLHYLEISFAIDNQLQSFIIAKMCIGYLELASLFGNEASFFEMDGYFSVTKIEHSMMINPLYLLYYFILPQLVTE